MIREHWIKHRLKLYGYIRRLKMLPMKGKHHQSKPNEIVEVSVNLRPGVIDFACYNHRKERFTHYIVGGETIYLNRVL